MTTRLLLVHAAALLLGLLLGSLVRQKRLCFLGSISDQVVMNSPERLLTWVGASLVAIAGAHLWLAWGWLPLADVAAVPMRLNWLGHLVGGAVFAWGMVRASGCPTRNLVRCGEGQLGALVVVLGVALGASMLNNGPLAWLREALVRTALDLPQQPVLWLSLGAGSATALLLAALALGLLLLLWWRFKPSVDQGLTAFAAGALIALGWLIGALLGHAENPETLEMSYLASGSGRLDGVSLVGPLSNWLYVLLLSRSGFSLSFGASLALGLVLAGVFWAKRSGQFRWQAPNPSLWGRNFSGGLAMGAGGSLALGCTLGQGLSGMSLLSFGAMLTVAAMGLTTWLLLRRMTQ